MQGKTNKMRKSIRNLNYVVLAVNISLLLWLLLANNTQNRQATSTGPRLASWNKKSFASMNASLSRVATLLEDLHKLYAEGAGGGNRADRMSAMEMEQKFSSLEQSTADAVKAAAGCSKEVSKVTALTAQDTMQKAKEMQSTYCRAFLMADLSPSPERYVQTALTAFGKVTPIVIYAVPDFVSQQIREQGAWDGPKVKILLDKLRLVQNTWAAKDSSAEAVFLDIGANIGAFTLAAASHGYRVLAFEPMPGNEAALRQSICLSSNFTASGLDMGFMERITYYSVGLSTKESFCMMVSEEDNNSDGIMVCGNEVSDPNYRPPEGYRTQGRVRITRIDDAITVADRERIAVAKIDVEGFEQTVVRGGPRIFGGNIPFIVCEFNAPSYRPTPATFLHTWHVVGYEIHYGQDGWDSPVIPPSEFEMLEIQAGTDIFLINKEFAGKK